jgi:hypothetical protein
MGIDGFKHFYEFYEKLNVISEIINKTTTTIPSDPTPLFNKIFGDSQRERDMKKAETDERPTLKAILDKQHESGDLIKTFMYDKPTGKTGKTETNFIAKNLRIGSTTEIILIAINKKAEVPGATAPPWFDSDMFSIFNLDEFDDNDRPEEATEKKNIKELHSVIHNDYTLSIKTLFRYHDINRVDTGLTTYVWKSKYNMLGLLTQPFLLLTFDMYFYNVKGAPLFRKNFDVIDEEPDVEAATSKVSVESLLAINIFKQNQLPTFLMLLIYYAGYSFNINVDDITSKFRNKFNQSSNKTSFPIKLYVPISHPMETKYNNLLKSAIKPDSVDLNVETLQVYHVGYQIASLWDYVNGKLTILINNMLNSNSKDDKARLTDLFKKKYTSNNLFLFECINELKKYKEYILNPANITTIEFPMSTLKTLEILILKLSYILSVLEPTFIPIETMSFDVVMNGKTLKYVINSELQATNISIDDNISNDKLMAAILSTRAGVMDSTPTKETANLLLSETESIEIIKSSIQKEADISRSNKIEKNIAYTKIHDEFEKSTTSLAQLTDDFVKAHFSADDLNLTETYMNRVVQNSELKLADKKAELEKNYADEIYSAATALLRAFTPSDYPTEKQFADFRKPKSDINNDPAVQGILDDLRAKKKQLATAAGQSPQQLATMARSRRRVEEARKTRSKVKRTLGGPKESGAPDEPDDTLVASEDTESVDVTIMPYHTEGKRRCGLSFGQYNTVIQHDYRLGRIVNTDKNNIPVNMLNRRKKYRPEEWWPFTKNIAGNTISIGSGYILAKIEAKDSGTSTFTTHWDKYDTRPTLDIIGEKKSTFDNDVDKKAAINVVGRNNEEMIYKQQYLLDKLDNLRPNNVYRFTFEKPKVEHVSTVDTGSAFGGGKNTTKKVNRRQRQGQIQGKTHSKTKKVLENEVIN